MTPLLNRIKIATVASSDLDQSQALYETWLGYRTQARTRIPQALAESWGAPAAANREMLMMSSPAAADVCIRFVETDPVPGYKALTTYGWNAIEIILDDTYAFYEKIKDSPFEILDTPKPLDGYPSIVAMQVKGPSEEALYLTMESGDRSKSALPLPNAFVGRPFIMVMAGTDVDVMLDWYAEKFRMTRRRVMSTPIQILQKAQNLPSDHQFTLGTMALADHGNILEFNAYPPSSGPRPRREGQLPSGVAMVSFGTADLDAIDLPFITPPETYDAPGYASRRAATAVGPAGELIEIIEE